MRHVIANETQYNNKEIVKQDGKQDMLLQLQFPLNVNIAEGKKFENLIIQVQNLLT